MGKTKETQMKYLPQVAVSWEAAALFSLLCASAGAALFGLGTRRREKQSGPATVKFKTRNTEELTSGQNGDEDMAPGEDSIETLAQALWLKTDTPVPILSDSGDPAAPGFSHPLTRAFWAEEIEPHSSTLKSRGDLPVIKRILVELDRHGLCSSVTSGDGKNTFAPTAKRFSRVTLLSHSLRTARRMREIHDSVYTEKLLYGKHIAAALAHDVGKMEHLRPGGDGRYVKDDHAAASARALNTWAMECGGESASVSFRAAVAAVRNHHRNVNETDPLLCHLKKADTAAREEEFSGRRTNPRARPGAQETSAEPPEWLIRDIPLILRLHIEPVINEETLPKQPFARAISSTNGVVYVCPHYLFDGVREHMEKEDIADMRFFDSSRTGELGAKLLVTNSLKSRSWVADGVGDGYYAAFWNYEYGGKKVSRGGFWIPVFAEAFGTSLSSLEKRKGTELRRVTAFSPCLARRGKK